jgi:hypothetical protein
MSGSEIDLSPVRGESGESGVHFGAELIAYTEAVMGGDPSAIAASREAVQARLGAEGVADSAAVMAMFNVVDRVADATGIPIDPGVAHDMRYAIGSELGMSHLTPEKRASQ